MRLLEDLETSHDFRYLLSQIKKDGGSTMKALEAVFQKVKGSMRVRDAINLAINCLKDYRMSLYNTRFHIADEDIVEQGEFIERDGVSLQKLTPYQLQLSVQGRQEMLDRRNQEIVALREQFDEAQKKHAAELEQMKTALAKAKKDVSIANNGKKQLREQNSELKRQLDENLKDTGKRKKTNHVVANPVSPTPQTSTQDASSPTRHSDPLEKVKSFLRRQNRDLKASPTNAFKHLDPSERKKQPKVYMMAIEGKKCETYAAIEESLTSRDGTLKGASSLLLSEATIANMNKTAETIGVITPPIGGTAPQLEEVSEMVVLDLKYGNFACPEGTMVERSVRKLNKDISKHIGLRENEAGIAIFDRIPQLLHYKFLNEDEEMRKEINKLTSEQKADPEFASLFAENIKLIATTESDAIYLLENVHKPMLKGLKERDVKLGNLHNFFTEKSDRFGIDGAKFVTMLEEVLGHEPCVVKTKHLTHGLREKTVDVNYLSTITEAIKAQFHFVGEATIVGYSRKEGEEYLNTGVAMRVIDQLLSRLHIQPEARDGEYNHIKDQRGKLTMERNANSKDMTLKEFLQNRAKKGAETLKANAATAGVSRYEYTGGDATSLKRSVSKKAYTDKQPVSYCYPDGNVCKMTFGGICKLVAEQHGSEFMDENEKEVDKERVRERVRIYKAPSCFSPVCEGGPWVANSDEICLEKQERGKRPQKRGEYNAARSKKISDTRKANTDKQPVSYCYPDGKVCQTTFGGICNLVAERHGSEFMDENEKEVDKERVRGKVQQYKTPSILSPVCEGGPWVANSDEICLEKYNQSHLKKVAEEK
ncbi:predicted protein [Chaetoceros tenuissimus]|uniref:Uncharacterized protein n=1 Tax=Chaetoceros tenuissimus TaxID=426638 RepID=A0AAD3CW16_9STRA|nr:predicted protein [Chaetoceros tenuissimus]